MQTITPTSTLKLLTVFLVFALGALLISGIKVEEATDSTPQDSRPNIIFMIADDWSYPHAGAYGDKTVRTPTFDALAKNGALFGNAYCAAPSCAPSRASILLSRYPHQMESAGNLWSVIPDKFPELGLALKGSRLSYRKKQKGLGPGRFQSRRIPA